MDCLECCSVSRYLFEEILYALDRSVVDRTDRDMFDSDQSIDSKDCKDTSAFLHALTDMLNRKLTDKHDVLYLLLKHADRLRQLPVTILSFLWKLNEWVQIIQSYQ